MPELLNDVLETRNSVKRTEGVVGDRRRPDTTTGSSIIVRFKAGACFIGSKKSKKKISYKSTVNIFKNMATTFLRTYKVERRGRSGKCAC